MIGRNVRIDRIINIEPVKGFHVRGRIWKETFISYWLHPTKGWRKDGPKQSRVVVRHLMHGRNTAAVKQ